MTSGQALIDSDAEWLIQNFMVERVGEYHEITTPFLNVNNDCLQIYVKHANGSLLLTDDGATIDVMYA